MKNENQHFSADRRKFGRHFWIGAAVAGALSAAVIFTAASAVYRKNRFDLKIGEEKVGSKEYQLCMDLVKYDVKMEIQKRYDALYGEDFWEQSYEGQYGYEILADHTVEKIKYIHAVYYLAEEYGDVSDGSFALPLRNCYPFSAFLHFPASTVFQSPQSFRRIHRRILPPDHTPHEYT